MGSSEDAIWNRAAGLRGKPGPRPGDTALSALLLVHSQIMSGGVLNCVQDSLSDEALEAGYQGYRYFGLGDVVDVLVRAKGTPEADAADVEARLDAEYSALVPNDSAVVERFETMYREYPGDFGPLD